MKKFWLTTLSGMVIGGVLGFIYWKFVGCESGACAITSSPYNSTGYGMLMGALLLSSGWPKKSEKTNQS